MLISWLEEKCKTPWGIFKKNALIDTHQIAMPDDEAYIMASKGVVEVVDPTTEPPVELQWDEKKQKIVPFSGKPKLE